MADVTWTLTKSFALQIMNLLPDSGAEARLKSELRNYHDDPTSANHSTALATLDALSESRQFELKRQLGGESAGKKSPDITDNS